VINAKKATKHKKQRKRTKTLKVQKTKPHNDSQQESNCKNQRRKRRANLHTTGKFLVITTGMKHIKYTISRSNENYCIFQTTSACV